MRVDAGTTAKLVPNQPVAVQPVAPATPAMDPDTHERIDRLEQAMLKSGNLVDLPLAHTFTDRLYTRAIFMPAGALVVSKIHNTEHPFAIMQGRVRVFIPGSEVEELVAPHLGVTQPGTRRVLFVVEDTIWVTFHVNESDTHDLDEIEERIIEKRVGEDGRTAFDQYAEILRQIQSEQEPGSLPTQYDYQGAP